MSSVPLIVHQSWSEFLLGLKRYWGGTEVQAGSMTASFVSLVRPSRLTAITKASISRSRVCIVQYFI